MIDDSTIGDSIKKIDFKKKYTQHGAEINKENQNIKFYFGETFNHVQIGNGFLEVDKQVKKVDDTNFTNADQTTPVNNGLAYTFQDVRLSTNSDTEI